MDTFLQLDLQQNGMDPFLQLDPQQKGMDPFLQLDQQQNEVDPVLQLDQQPALGRKLRFSLFFPLTVDPLILEPQIQAKNIPMVLPSSPL